MRYGISIPAFGDYADARYLGAIAKEAEDAGWDGFFIWDHSIFDPTFHAMVDPFTGVAAIAMQTQRIRTGVMVTPLPRRRPWIVARQTVSLDILSGGRLVVGVGLGDPVGWEYGLFHEETDAKIRAQKLDEGLDILTGLWSGEAFSYQGEHYQIDEMVFLPTALQKPHIPIWVGGGWDKTRPMRRAARYDGYFPLKWRGVITPDEWRGMMQQVNSLRDSDAPFDWVHGDMSSGSDKQKDADYVRPYAEIGITWWIENIDPWRYGLKWEDPIKPEHIEQMNERIRQGPPRID